MLALHGVIWLQYAASDQRSLLQGELSRTLIKKEAKEEMSAEVEDLRAQLVAAEARADALDATQLDDLRGRSGRRGGGSSVAAVSWQTAPVGGKVWHGHQLVFTLTKELRDGASTETASADQAGGSTRLGQDTAGALTAQARAGEAVELKKWNGKALVGTLTAKHIEEARIGAPPAMGHTASRVRARLIFA
jgi:hypothetical protein